MRNVVRAKLVCNPIDQALTSAKSFSNYPGFPPNNVTMLNDICIFAPNWTDQVCFDDSVHFGSMAFLVRNTDPDAGFSWPGYVLYMVNTTRVCSYYISNQCYASFGQDTCIAEALNRLLNDTQSFQWTPGAIAGVATAAGVVVVVAVLCCVFRKRLLLCLVKISRKSLQELESNSSPTIDGEGTSSLILTSSDQNKKRSVAQTVRLGVLLGSGSFGRVYRGRWHGTDVAVKIISCTPDELPKVLKEAEVMMQLHHPNIVRAYQCSVWNPTEQQRALQAGKKAAAGAATPAQKASGRRAKADRQPGDELLPGDVSSEEGRQEVQVWLVLELCTGGTLKDAVSMGKLKAQGRLEMAKLLCRLLDAATGMAYLHSKGVLHGDLKAGNVLLQATVHGTYGQVAKISDFGLAATLLDGATHRSTASMGTITHMAPEVLRSGHMSTAADVYSFGIMMWEVYTNQQAHQGLHYGAVVERVVVRGERPKVPTDMPNEYSLLMRSCWDGDAAKRPNFAQVITCLELLLDNLTSDSDGRISEGSEGAASTSSASGKGGNASGGNASSVKMEDLLARKSEPVSAAADAAPDSACGKDSSGAGSSSAAAAGVIAAGKPGGLLAGSSSSRPSAASGSGLGAATPGTSQLLEQRQQQLQMVSVPSGGKALLERLASGASTSSSHGMLGATSLLGTSSRAGQTAGTWSSSLGGSGSMGSTLGVPATPQQPGAQQQQQQLGAWQQMRRLGLRQGQQRGSKDEAEADGGQLVQDL
ncbi:hypothetical protein OEZ85_006913 [Tetradesmus obliquus]|uniref:Protein kinase domain-containing protein n=1 Tax=Tetradesmus obliquus TaxID=3088 RepID=A0ABY8TW49_TETOB|nr:hypothetical protein OEZ85_006913 [Tetradesmus obliquus]